MLAQNRVADYGRLKKAAGFMRFKKLFLLNS
jgi:hypothetical protein